MDEQSRLKIYFGPDEPQRGEVDTPQAPGSTGVRVKLTDVIGPLSDAIDHDRTWLRDFRDDQLTISKDLFDVLNAYRRIRRSA